MNFETIIAQYGLPAVFAGSGIEGETIAMTGGFLAHQQMMPLTGVMAAAAAGSFVSDQILFAIGRYYRKARWVRRIEAKPAFAKALDLLERHPTGFIFAFRFLYGLRTISPIAIGTSKIPARTFIFLNIVAASIWGVLFPGIGYLFGNGIEQIFGRLHSAMHMLLAILAIALIAITFVQLARWLNRHRPHGK